MAILIMIMMLNIMRKTGLHIEEKAEKNKD
jgi:hypothetical protein